MKIDESRNLKKQLNDIAKEHYQKHQKAFEKWKEGNISKVWIDKDCNICIEYESGNWWHYNEKGEWW